MELDAHSNESTAPAAIPGTLEDSRAKKRIGLFDRECMIKKLFTRTSSEVEDVTFHRAFLCNKCAICDVTSEFRPCSQISHINKFLLAPQEADVTEMYRKSLDRSINNLYWKAMKDFSRSKYPVAQMLYKGVFTTHYLMKKYDDEKDTDFFFVDLEKANDLWFFEGGAQRLNAIQVEELRFVEAFKRVISHYRKRSYESDMLSRVETLDVAQNILFGLKALLEAEFACRLEFLKK